VDTRVRAPSKTSLLVFSSQSRESLRQDVQRGVAGRGNWLRARWTRRTRCAGDAGAGGAGQSGAVVGVGEWAEVAGYSEADGEICGADVVGGGLKGKGCFNAGVGVVKAGKAVGAVA
jgi:hypothetical protein